MSDFGLLIIWNDPYGMTLKGKSDKKMPYTKMFVPLKREQISSIILRAWEYGD